MDRLQKGKKESKKKKDSRFIYQSELDKACFQHDMAYGDFKDLTSRATSEKILRDKAFNIAKNPKYDGYLTGLASMAYKCFAKKASGKAMENEIMSNKELSEELHKPIIKKLQK